MHYISMSNLLEIIKIMQEKTSGITYKEIMKTFGVSERTAERWIKHIIEVMPTVKGFSMPTDREKHFGFENYYTDQTILKFEKGI